MYYLPGIIEVVYCIPFQVKALCREWFPIEYPDSWYADITSSPQFYALAATLHSRIIGLLVAETKPLAKLNKEVRAEGKRCRGILTDVCGREEG